MPEALLESGSEFDRTKVLLGRWLRENVESTRVLTQDELTPDGVERRFCAGWGLAIQRASGAQIFSVLIDDRFPYSPIRVACRAGDLYLRRPHVEPGGLLCLPRRQAPSAGVESAIAAALSDTISLVEEWEDPAVVEAEFQREFVSYWSRSQEKGATPIRSLLDTRNTQVRRIVVLFAEEYTLVGESSDQLLNWLKNRGRAKEPKVVPGAFIYLDVPPVPPFPRGPGELFTLLQRHSPSATGLLARLSVQGDLTIVAQAHSQSGDGVIGMTVTTPRNFDGFRKSDKLSPHAKLALWRAKSDFRRTTVNRFDAAWVHGRGFNKDQPTLETATALILGCGSLGSQVAHRLAQSGVGGLVLADPEQLSAANVGRHTLGIDSVNINKAEALAGMLRQHFPHLRRIDDHPKSWQSLYERDRTIFEQASVIVSCLGEWSAEGQLGEWQVREHTSPPIVYGWLDEFGTASHAIVLTGIGPALSCILDPDGGLRVPETLWDGGGLLRAEPACGTLFQPYGPIDVAHAEVLVSRLCIDTLTGRTKEPCHRVYAGSTSQLIEAGGRWSASHLKSRPAGFDGPFEYERSLRICGQCHSCQNTR
jgi:hypothetical protein